MAIKSSNNSVAHGLGRLLIVLVASLWFTGCANIISAPTDLGLYNLTPEGDFAADVPVVKWQLIIEEPVPSGGLDSSRIALRPEPTQLDYYADVRWTERAPKMIQTLIAESFENSRRIVAVGGQSVGLRSDFDLKTELRDFQAEYFTGTKTPRARVRLTAKLVSQPRREIVAARVFESIVSADATDIPSIVRAFDRAFRSVVGELVEWTLLSGEQAQRSRK